MGSVEPSVAEVDPAIADELLRLLAQDANRISSHADPSPVNAVEGSGRSTHSTRHSTEKGCSMDDSQHSRQKAEKGKIPWSGVRRSCRRHRRHKAAHSKYSVPLRSCKDSRRICSCSTLRLPAMSTARRPSCECRVKFPEVILAKLCTVNYFEFVEFIRDAFYFSYHSDAVVTPLRCVVRLCTSHSSFVLSVQVIIDTVGCLSRACACACRLVSPLLATYMAVSVS